MCTTIVISRARKFLLARSSTPGLWHRSDKLFLFSRFHILTSFLNHEATIQSFFHFCTLQRPCVRFCGGARAFGFGGLTNASLRETRHFQASPSTTLLSSLPPLYIRCVRIASQKQDFETVRIVSQRFTIVYPRESNSDFFITAFGFSISHYLYSYFFYKRDI